MAMKSLTTQEQMFIFNVLENGTIKIKEAGSVAILMDKLDHNIKECIKKDKVKNV